MKYNYQLYPVSDHLYASAQLLFLGGCMTWKETSVGAYKHFNEIVPRDLVSALRHRFAAEHISKYFKSPDYAFSGVSLSVTPDDSILIEFDSLQAEFPERYSSKQYRLLLLLALHNLDEISNVVILELSTSRRRDNVDRIIIWTCHELNSATIHTLKEHAIDVISIPRKDVEITSSISHYIPVGPNHDYALALNLAADLLLKRLKKMFHLVLSEVAAPIYDELYAKQKIATEEMMRFEELQLKELIRLFLPLESDRSVAVDVGCGTGRHSLPLAKLFKNVYGFDFSPGMIAVAEKKKAKDDIRNVLFSTADLEYETVRDEGYFISNDVGRVDLIVASFGLGSFIEDTSGMLRRFYSWLREDGMVFLSFYNEQSIVSELTPNWRDTSLAAHLDPESSTLRVELSAKTVFHIYCKPYSQDVRNAIMESFDIQYIMTYPTLMALMPNGLLQSGSKAVGLFRFIDETLADHGHYRLGHYFSIVAKKKSGHLAEAFSRVIDVLVRNGAEYSLIPHPPAVSFEDVRSHVEMEHDGLPVKTLLLRRKEDKKLIAVVMPARVKADIRSIAQKVGSQRLYFGSDRDVLFAGFPLGGVAPFGFRLESITGFYLDESLEDAKGEWIYAGSGDNTKTLRVKRSDFFKIVSDYERLPR